MMSVAADGPAPAADTTPLASKRSTSTAPNGPPPSAPSPEQHDLGSAVYGFQTDNSDSSGEGLRSDVIPWINVEISIRFSENVVVQEDDLVVRGVRSGVLDAALFSYNPGTFTATWTFDQPLAADLVMLSLDGDSATGVTDSAGTPLGADTSGPGGAPRGHDFRLLLPVLPGDVNRNGAVVANDFSEVKRKFFSTSSMTSTARARSWQSTSPR
jgi:hypothetical protein